MTVDLESNGTIESKKQPLMPDVGVLAFVPDEWGEQWQPRHHVLWRMAKYFHVVWVNPAPGWRDTLRKPWSGYRIFPEPPPGFHVYYPEPWLPKFYHPARLAQATFRQRLHRAHRILSKHGCKQTILYLWRPEFHDVLEERTCDLSCYHVDDEYSFSDTDVPMSGCERRLIAAVDQVFIHSPALMEKKGWVNPNTAFVPNGVDYDAFAHAQPEPTDIASIPHPRIGYSGWIKKTLDWPLLLRLACERRDWSFVFAGGDKKEDEIVSIVGKLSSLPNVYFLGEKTTIELAKYPRYFDVCIMPYAMSDYTRYIYPMKLHEYLASGRPTIASRLRSLDAFSDVVALANTAEEWLDCIAQALSENENAAACRSVRQQVAREHDWHLLVAKIVQAMTQRMKEKDNETRRQWMTDTQR